MTVIYGTTESTGTWDRPGAQTPGETTGAAFNPFPVPGGVQSLYQNKCVDLQSGEWVFWETFFQDYYGSQYPGAAFDSATYRVQVIKFDREQL